MDESMHLHGTGEICSLINRLLHEFLGLAPAIIRTILFFEENIISLLDELPKIIIPNFIME
jgi:uncharacterized protein YbcI